ncbi:GNAT family N-acetyltransferase [Ochrobactrum sp. Q0168]|uniref:GNAT family N-acetyltransferase n=1 Tax=Ochrobactrum sp. Q0168 TaxID=2793241 RepID=UPI0018EADDA7|nr:GNAT family N-acetyltransferase [Ochrobactrum sp. Q0168]
MISNGKSMLLRAEDVDFGWYDGKPDPKHIAGFFASNVSPTYISHTDIQWGRASGVGQWSPDLHEKIMGLVIQTKGSGQRERSETRLAIAMQDAALVGIAFVTVRRDGACPYAILEDLLIGQSVRNQGIGSAMLNWVRDECRVGGIRKMFLESNLDNKRAHALFHRLGFQSLSVVMSCDL